MQAGCWAPPLRRSSRALLAERLRAKRIRSAALLALLVVCTMSATSVSLVSAFKWRDHVEPSITLAIDVSKAIEQRRQAIVVLQRSACTTIDVLRQIGPDDPLHGDAQIALEIIENATGR